MVSDLIIVYVAIAVFSGMILRKTLTPLMPSRPRRAAAIAWTIAILVPASPVLLIATYVPVGRAMVNRIVLGLADCRPS
jgi:hypothetical protein